MLRKQPSIQLVGEAEDGEELIAVARQTRADVIVTDIKMPRMDGVAATKYLSKEYPHIGIIALSMFDEEHLIVEMLEAGARGYLLKNAHKDEIIEAIKTVNNRQTYYCNDTSAKLAQMIARSKFGEVKEKKLEFTEKELSVIRYICQEMTNKEMARQMKLSTRTIEGYREKIQEKIGAKNAAGVVVYAIKNNIYEVP